MSILTLNEKREVVRNEYPGLKWKEKVDRMSDKQVLALYFVIIERRRECRASSNYARNSLDNALENAYKEPKPYEEVAKDILKENQLSFCDISNFA